MCYICNHVLASAEGEADNSNLQAYFESNGLSNPECVDDLTRVKKEKCFYGCLHLATKSDGDIEGKPTIQNIINP